jgi:lysophospholipase L1-like esterase
MARRRSGWLDIGLAILSLLIVVVLSVAADRVAGLLLPAPSFPDAAELIFPPHSDRAVETPEFSYTAHINALGFRGNDVKPGRTDAYRVAVIGDSFTYGWGVELEDTWLKRLEFLLREKGLDAEVLNLGKPGAGPPYYADLAERAMPLLQPDLVIVAMLQGDDLASSGPEGLEAQTEYMLDGVRRIWPHLVEIIWRIRQSGPYADAQKPVNLPLHESAEMYRQWQQKIAAQMIEEMPHEARKHFEAIDPEVRKAFREGRFNPWRVELATVNPGYYANILDLEDSGVQQAIRNMTGQLIRIRKAAARYDAECLVLALPHGCYVNQAALTGLRRCGYEAPETMLESDAPDEAIQAAAAAAGLPFVKTSAPFRARCDDATLYYPLDGHLTPQGHRLLAETLARPLYKRIEP